MSTRKPAVKSERYTEADLTGIQVSHSESLFKEGQDVILTLKDANVLDEQEDVLENVNLVDHEKALRNTENRTNRAGYSAFDEPEYDAFGRFKKKSVLSKYDEEINGLKKEAFRIGQDESKRLEQLEEIKKSIAKERGEVSLEMPKYKVASEYYTEAELITFKKPKKQKKSKKSQKQTDDDDGPITADSLLPLDDDRNGNDEHHGSRNRRRQVELADEPVDEAFLEHQSLLQNAIKIKLKDKAPGRGSERSSERGPERSSSKSSAEKDLGHRSKRVKTESDVPVKSKRHVSSDEEMNDEDDDDEGLQIPDEEIYGVALEEDDLQRELMSTLDKVRKLKQKERSEAETLEKISETVQILNEHEIKEESSRSAPNGEGNIVINSTAEFCRNLGDLNSLKYDREEELLEQFENDLREEEEEGGREDDDMEIDDDEPHSGYKEQVRSKWSEVDFRSDPARAADLADAKPILEEEPDVSHGLAGALQLAMKKGYLDKEIKKGNISAKTSSLQAKNYTIEEKFHDDKLGRRERYSGALSEFKEKPNYRPDVKLEYNDDTGRQLNAKEAFRVLSHKFHGKGPGKNKIDKRMKKLQQETKLKSMTSIDTPLGTTRMLQEKQKELNTPYVILSANQHQLSKKP